MEKMVAWIQFFWKKKAEGEQTGSIQEIDQLKLKYKEALQEINEMRARFILQSERHKQHTVEMILRDFLPIVDSIQRAVESESSQDNPWLDGFKKTYQQFQRVLIKYEVQPVPSKGVPFDPAWHEAVSVVKSDEIKDGIVLESIEQGYQINGRLLRAGKVVVVKNR